jgi:putative membrane protein
MMNWFGGMSIFGGILMLLFFVAVVLLLVWAVRSFTSTRRNTEDDTPLDILNRRYAAGEISQAEYEQARRVLDGHGA